MLKFLKRLIKYFAFFCLGVVACFIAGFTVASNYAIEHITHLHDQKGTEDYINPNLIEISHIGNKYIEELDLFEKMSLKISTGSMPEFCPILCNSVYMDRERLKDEKTAYILEYFNSQGNRAFNDPLFRLKLKELNFVSQIFTVPLRSLFNDLKTLGPINNFSDKFIVTVQFETVVAKELLSLYWQRHSLKKELEQIKLLRKLLHSCQQGYPVKKIVSECKAS